MTILVSKNGNIPEEPPHRIRLSSGFTRTDSKTFTREELEDAGYRIVDPKPIDGSVYSWDGMNWVKIMG